MADIKRYLNNIKNAIRGIEVRGSIHDGIDAINKEVESTTKRQDNLESVHRQLIINAGDSNAEVVDARVDKTTGESYSTVGDRLDKTTDRFVSVDKELKNKVSKLDPHKTLNLSRIYRKINKNAAGAASYMQGATKIADDKAIYAIYDVTTPDSNIVDLIEVDLKNGTELRRKTLMIGHANSMTFNKKTNELIIATLKKFVNGIETYVDELIIIDYLTLDVKKNVNLGGQRVVRAVAYDDDNDKYVILIDNFIVAICSTHNFSVEKELTLAVPKKIKSFITQSLEVWNESIYLCGYSHNYISAFDYRGNNIQNYYIPDYIDNMYLTGELEDISATSDGSFLLFSCQNIGSLEVVNMISEFSVTKDTQNGMPFAFLNAGGPKKIYVDANSTSHNPDGSEENPFSQLNEAILSMHNSIFSNVEILLKKGTYNWTYVGNLNASIRIIGNSQNDTFLKGIFVNGGDVNLSKITVKKSENSSYEGLISAFNARVVIDNVIVDSTSTHGIYANSGSEISVRSLTDLNANEDSYTIYAINCSDVKFQKTASNIVKIYADNSTRVYPQLLIYNNSDKLEREALRQISLPKWVTKLVDDNSFKFIDIMCGIRVTNSDDILLQTYRIQTSNYLDFSINLSRVMSNYTILSSTKLSSNIENDVIKINHDYSYFTKIDKNGSISTNEVNANEIGSILIYRIFLTN